MFGSLDRDLVAILLAGTIAGPAVAQRSGTRMRDSVGDAAADLLGEGRANEARIVLLKAMRASRSAELRATYRLELANTFLYDGNYGDASKAYNLVLAGRDSVTVDSLVRWAHHGLALIDAFNGRTVRAAAHYTEALHGPSTIRDTIEMLVLTAQHDSALRAIDRLARARPDSNALQFVQAFRGLSWMLAGHCTNALPEVAKAPHQDRPVPIAIRGRCAMKHGQRIPALAMRDSVLKHQVTDPFAWTVLIARDAARKIE